MAPALRVPGLYTVLALSISLIRCARYEETKSFLRKQLPNARRALGAENDTFLRLRGMYAKCLCLADIDSRDNVAEAVTIFEELSSTVRRIYGTSHPLLETVQHDLELMQEQLAAFDAPDA